MNKDEAYRLEDEAYRLEDGLTSLTSAIQEIERRTMRAALKQGVSGDSRRQMLAHLDTMRNAINKLPEVK
jgi:hypothetical protein